MSVEELRGGLEPQAEAVAKALHAQAAAGSKVSDAALVSPCLMSIAISLRRIADHFTPPPDQSALVLSQAEHNLNDILSDLAANLRRDR